MVSLTVGATAIAALALGGWFGERGNGNIKGEERKVGEFTGVDVAGGVHVDVSVGSQQRVTVTGDENLLPLIQTTVKNGVLQLERKEEIRPTQPIKLTVVTPKLERVGASGGVTMNVQAAPSKRFTLMGSGGSRIQVRGIDADDLDMELSGGVTLRIAGKARAARLELSGGVDLDAQELDVQKAKIDASGGVQARLAVSEAITGEASGGVNVRVKGRPSIDVDTSGASAIRTQ